MGSVRRRRWPVAWQELCEVVDGFDEVALPGGDEEVDGVEVCLAVEAAAEVGAGVDGRQVSLAARAEEGDLPVALLVGPLEQFQEGGQGDVVAQAAQVVTCDKPGE